MIFDGYFLITITLLVVLISFSLYYSMIRRSDIRNYIIKILGNNKGQQYQVHFQRLLGILLFGAMPILIVIFLFKKQLSDYGLSLPVTATTLYLSSGLGALIVLVNAFAAKKANNLKEYPQIRAKIWTGKLLFLSGIGWTGYIFSYELLFRGILLTESIAAFGIVTAVAINIALYALVHIPKGLNETIGSIPFGLILCAATIYTGNIWTAFFLHTILALSNEWFSIYYHDEMAVIKAN